MSKFFIISGPSGSGKTTLAHMLIKNFDNVIRSISYTTRKIRPGEFDTKDYFFINKNEFETKIKNNDFLEYANVFGNYYGTSKKFVEDKLKEKKHVILTIDVQGAEKLKGKIDAVYIFIKPPSIEVLKKRLEKRNQDSDETIDKRLKLANKEMAKEILYDYVITNDDLNEAYNILKEIFLVIFKN